MPRFIKLTPTIALVAFALFIPPAQARASCVWAVVPSANAKLGSWLHAVSADSSADAWAVGVSQTGTLAEHWSGGRWTVAGTLQTPFSDLQGVAALSPTNAWAVGRYLVGNVTRPLIEHWNGTRWAVALSPLAGDNRKGAYLSGIAAVSATDIWAAGTYYGRASDVSTARTLIEHFDGTRWSIVPSPNATKYDDQLASISVANRNDIWSVGNYTDFSNGFLSRTLAEHWDGARWAVVRSPNPAGQAPLFTAIAAASSSKAFAVGYYYDSRNVAQTLGALWDGRRWVLQKIPNYGYDSRLYGITAVSPVEVIAVGMYDTPLGRQRTFALRWSGAGWTITPTPNVAYGNYLQGAGRIPGTSDVWAVGSSTNQDNTYQSLIQRYRC